MKLKTLNDLIVKDLFSEKDNIVRINELKQEAIKWVKDIDEELEEHKEYQGTITEGWRVNKVQGLIATGEWIKNFFNITEEDLK